MRLLLTRAAEDAARTRTKLEAAGHTVFVSPVLVFEPTGEPWTHNQPEGLVATSSRAFSAIADESPDLLPLPLYLVGARTEAAARRHGFAGPVIVAPDGAGLVAILQGQPAMRLLYLAGVDRKPDIEAGLAATLHRLMVIETYEAVAVESLKPEVVAALRNGVIDGVLHYSRRSAEIFLMLAARASVDQTKTPHLCLSSDVAAPLREAGCLEVHVAPTPDEAGMRSLTA
ncbi:uroporphyrinogen-III synthase [Beijerinckia sp. L45]|uniref:uroporphyrinogen-III synthase n=1 Tax=Beijerinckia sp. L45 TaxID=1641855 RepID=UPI00131B5E76|nr:uroporphyrinogen-III synthase [Beijerinckia sp. L45]